MKLRTALIGFVAALGLSTCGKGPGTSLYVVAYFKASAEIRTLYFSGQTPNGADLFEATYRPPTPAAENLVSPQKVRIYLGDDLDGDKVTVSLYAVDKNNEFVQFGVESRVVVKGQEVEMKIDMNPFAASDAGFKDAGDEDAGFIDAGFIDAGPLPDGGVLRCACDGGCCFPGTSTCFVPAPTVFDAGAGIAPVNFTLHVCGPAGAFCTLALCDQARTNTCHNGNCSCGKLGQCPVGTRCSVDGNGASSCVCDPFSNCQGCCTSTGQCTSTRVQCGSAGNACAPCTGIVVGPGELTCSQPSLGMPVVEQTGVCSSSSSCATCTAANKCCSEMKCLDAAWPRCKRNASNNVNVCQACDLLRSDSCGMSGCVCGKEGPCSALQYCDRAANGGVGRCKAF